MPMKTAFLFPGQGVQKAGMGKDLYDTYPQFKAAFDRLNAAVDIDLLDVCFGGSGIDTTEFTQPAITSVCLSIVDILSDRDITPDLAGGLSLGEYPALVCGGAMTPEAAVKIVRKRGKLMQEAVHAGAGGLAAVIGLDALEIADIIAKSGEKNVYVSNHNLPGQTVIGGETEALKRVCDRMKSGGARMVKMLNVSGPFHTPMLRAAGEALLAELKKVDMKSLRVDVYANVKGALYDASDDISELLSAQVFSTVKWCECMQDMVGRADVFVEVGPGSTLSSMLKKIDKNVTVYRISDSESLEAAVGRLSRMRG